MSKKRKIKKRQPKTNIGLGYVPPSPNISFKDMTYRIMSQSADPDRSISDIARGIAESISGTPLSEDRYTGSFPSGELITSGTIKDRNKARQSRDLNHLLVYGNTKGLYLPTIIPETGFRYRDFLNKNYGVTTLPTYKGQIIQATKFNVPGEYQQLIEYLADRPNYGTYMGEGDWPIEDGTTPFKTVDDTASYRLSIRRNPETHEPELAAQDLIDFGGGYGSYGLLASMQGKILNKLINSPVLLDLSIPVNYSDNPRDYYHGPGWYDALLGIVNNNHIMEKSNDGVSDYTYPLVLPEIMVMPGIEVPPNLLKGIGIINTFKTIPKKLPGGTLNTNIDDLVDWLIREEGFTKSPTDIGDGKLTLGSGLTDPKWHKLFYQKGVWSDEDNRNAVREEVLKRYAWAKKDIPNWDILPDNSQKALIAYNYNYSFNKNNSPKMYKALAEQNWEEAARQMDATSRDPKFVKGLTARRKRELNWFLSGFNKNLSANSISKAGQKAIIPGVPVVPATIGGIQNLNQPISITRHQTGGTLAKVGDTWRNSENGQIGTVVRLIPDQEYVDSDGNLHKYTAPVIKYPGDDNEYVGLQNLGNLEGVTVKGHLKTPADNLDKVMLGTLSLPFLMYGTQALGGSIAANPMLWGHALQRTAAGMAGYEGVDLVHQLINGETWGLTASRILNIPRWAGDLTNPGGLLEGVIYNSGNKLLNTLNRNILNQIASRQLYRAISEGTPQYEEVFPGLVGWAPKQKVSGYHASYEQPFTPDYFFEGWPQRTHNAPHGLYIAQGEGPESGFLKLRPYIHHLSLDLDKPQILIGEVAGKTKNGIRNLIERNALSMGADGIIYSDIADNEMEHQIIAKSLHPDVNISKRATIGRLNGIEGEIPIITKENAASITPEQWTAAQDAAIARGDMFEAKRLADLHGEVNGYHPGFFHETEGPFYVFDPPGKNSSSDVLSPYGVFTKSTEKKIGLGGYQMPLSVKFERPLRVANKKELLHLLPEELRERILNQLDEGEVGILDYDEWFREADAIKKDIGKWLDSNGYDALQIDQDWAGSGLIKNKRWTDATIVPHPGRVKSPDAVTYDRHVRVPLGERHNSSINDTRWFGIPQPRTTNPSTQGVNPLETRLARLQQRSTYPHKVIYNENVFPELIRAVAKEISPDLTEDLLDQVVQILMAEKRGSYLSIGDDLGNTTSGIGIVDIKDAIKYLKEAGIENPTKTDIETIIAHEHGHSVKVSDEAMRLVKGYKHPSEFFTKSGLIFDAFKITDTKTEPMLFDEYIKLINLYLKQGFLDNGISELRDFLINNFKTKLSQRQIMSAINLFSVRAIPIGIITNELLNDGKTL